MRAPPPIALHVGGRNGPNTINVLRLLRVGKSGGGNENVKVTASDHAQPTVAFSAAAPRSPRTLRQQAQAEPGDPAGQQPAGP